MKKLREIVAVLCLLEACLCWGLASAENDVLYVANPKPEDRLHLRKEANTSSGSLGKYYNGVQVEALEFRKDGILVHPSPWRGKEGLGSLDTAPLGGIILLEQNEENRMRRLLPAEAAGPLLTQLLFTRKNADDVRAACALEERLLAQVPVWLLQNRGDAASAALCRDTLMEAQT